jgi:hypothetical protein
MGNSLTIAVVVGAETREKAINLLERKYKSYNFSEEYRDGDLYVERDSELPAVSTEEFVKEIFSTEEF